MEYNVFLQYVALGNGNVTKQLSIDSIRIIAFSNNYKIVLGDLALVFERSL